MLGLKLPTDPRWVNLAEKDLAEILTDHAYCEQKATTSCITLIQRYPERERLVKELMPIVTEEWAHFRTVLEELDKRGLAFGRQRKDHYVLALKEFVQKGGDPVTRMVDQLLLNALIEARSCERFRLLSLHLEDEYFRNFYHEFMVAEAGHYTLFLELAKEYGEEEQVMKRWDEFLTFEADVMKNMEVRGDRVH